MQCPCWYQLMGPPCLSSVWLYLTWLEHEISKNCTLLLVVFTVCYHMWRVKSWLHMYNNCLENLPKTYLKQLKVDNFHQSTTKHRIHPKFCWVLHWIITAITTPYNIFHVLHLIQKGWPAWFSIWQNNRKEQFVLMDEVGTDVVHAKLHVFKR